MLTTGTIDTDGARLYFERRGEGPALLMIAGGGGDAARYAAVADLLAHAYTVLTYDRRGNGNSRIADGAPAARMRMHQQSADARAIIEAGGFGSASVFGNSGGAVIGLDLAGRFPDAVDALVAHEPPVIGVLPDAADYTAAYDCIERIRARDGVQPAFAAFLAMNRLLPAGTVPMPGGGDTPAGTQPPPGCVQTPDWADFMMTHEMRAFVDYHIDFAQLPNGGVPVTLAGGRDSAGRYYRRTGEIIAGRLGQPFAEFPGGHLGFMEDPVAFAARLRQALAPGAVR